MSRRFWIITISIAVHLAIGISMFATGVWRLDRLDADHRLDGIAVMGLPEPSGSPEALPEVKFDKKEPKVVVDKDVQWDRKDTAPKETIAQDTKTGNGKGDDDSLGENKDGEDDDTGTCSTPPCDATRVATIVKPPAVPKPLPPPEPTTIGSTDLQHLRIAGSTQIHPPDATKQQIRRDNQDQVTGVVSICLTETGAMRSVKLIRSTTYAAYDALLLDGVRSWRYRPHTVDGRGVPVCSVVIFNYTMR